MLAHVLSSAVLGIDAYTVHVVVDVPYGPMMAVVGLPDAAVNESKERVRAAIKNSGFMFPYDKRVTVNLAPADVRKAGPSFDLPMALGILIATGQVTGEHLEGALVTGELSLDGSVRPIYGSGSDCDRPPGARDPKTVSPCRQRARSSDCRRCRCARCLHAYRDRSGVSRPRNTPAPSSRSLPAAQSRSPDAA